MEVMKTQEKMFNTFDKLRQCKKCSLVTNDRHAFLDHLVLRHNVKFASTLAVYDLEEAEFPEYERILPMPKGARPIESG